MRICDIEWDTDGEQIDSLPSEEIVENVPEEDVADYLSDKYGFCIFSFAVEREE